jgi:hypothetical protein
LAAAQARAATAGDLAAQVGIWRLRASLPPAGAAPEVAKPSDIPADEDLSLVALAARFQTDRLALDGQLATLFAPLRTDAQQGLAAALAKTDVPAAQAWWTLVQATVPVWSANLLSEPLRLPGTSNAYDRQRALAIPSLPAFLELTVAPGSHDLHVGICGFEGEDITEIYIGGWFGHISGIRPVPGGGDVVGFDHSQRLEPESAADAILSDWTTGTAFAGTQPTTFRIGVSGAGIVVARLEGGRYVPFMHTDALFNRPTAFALKAPIPLTLTQVRTFPAVTWSDQTVVRHRDPPAKTDF